jgi:hypothetical protein
VDQSAREKVEDNVVLTTVDDNEDSDGSSSSSPVRIKTEPSPEPDGEPTNVLTRETSISAPSPDVPIKQEPSDNADPAQRTTPPSTSLDWLDCKHHFYLAKPATSTTSQVVIPQSSKSTVTEALQGRSVLEYPTIYVLLQPPNGLPPGFMLEEDYLKTLPKNDPTIKPEPGEAEASRPNSVQTRVQTEERLDPNAILNMLKRDVTA